MKIDVQELERLLNDDKEFKRWTIEQLLDLKSKVENIERTFTWIKRLFLIIISIILSKVGIDLGGWHV